VWILAAVSRFRRQPELRPVDLPRERLWRIGGQLDQSGTLRIYTRANGQEVVRLTVVNLSSRSVDELRGGFGVGSQLGTPNADGRGLTWSVEGRWACQHVMKAMHEYLEAGSPLLTAYFQLLATGPIPPKATCDIGGCPEPVRARALCGPHLRAAGKLRLLGPATYGERTRCPVCADRHPFGNEHQPVHLCRRCREALRTPGDAAGESMSRP